MKTVKFGPGAKILGAVLAFVLVVMAIAKWRNRIAPARPQVNTAIPADSFPHGDNTPAGTASVIPVPAGPADLGRPLRVAINTWGGYAGGILANGGFPPNRNSIFYRNHGVEVELILMDDFPQSRAAFRTGGDGGGVDVMWATVDSFALEYPALEEAYHPVAFMQFDFSHGGDAIAVGPSIRTAADLRGKRIAYAEGTPSHYFLLYVLAQAGLTPGDIHPVTVASAIEAANVFKAGSVDACVSWAPDVFNAAEQRAPHGSGRILTSTREATNLIADIFYTRREFITAHPETFRRFVAGWMHGQREAKAHPALAVQAMARAFTGVSQEDAAAMLDNAELTDYWANRQFFEMDGAHPVGYDDIFQSASGLWRRVGSLTQVGQAPSSRDLRVLESVRGGMGAPPSAANTPPVGGTFAAPAAPTATAVVTRRMSIYFDPGSAVLDERADLTVEQIAELAATFGGAQMRVVGNTDSTGNAAANVTLSERRAQALVDALVARYHFDRNKFTVVGRGPQQPVCTENTDDCRRRNRRTDLEVLAPTPAPTPAQS